MHLSPLNKPLIQIIIILSNPCEALVLSVRRARVSKGSRGLAVLQWITAAGPSKQARTQTVSQGVKCQQLSFHTQGQFFFLGNLTGQGFKSLSELHGSGSTSSTNPDPGLSDFVAQVQIRNPIIVRADIRIPVDFESKSR